MAQWEAWASVGDRAFGWLDEDLFDAWAARAVALSTPEAKARIAAPMPGEDVLAQRARQRGAVLELVNAVANAYKAIDTPPLADDFYVDAVLKAANTSEDQRPEVAIPTANGGEPALGGRYLIALSVAAYQPASWYDLFRAWIDDTGTPHVESLTADLQTFQQGPNGGTFRRFGSYPPVRMPRLGEGPIPDPGPVAAGSGPGPQWEYAFYRYDCKFRPVLGGDCQGWETQMVAPALWDFELYAYIAYSLVERGARNILASARGYCVKRNMLLAAAVGLGNTDEGARLLGQARVWTAEAQAEGDHENQQIGQTMAAIGGVVSLANPVVGGIIQALGLLISVMPGTVAHAKDAFGRDWPAFQPFRISGTATDRPTHDVPAPPGFRYPPRGTLHVLAPPDLVTTAWLRVDQGEWRPATWQGSLRVGSHFVEGRSTIAGKQGWGRTVRVNQNATTTLDADASWFEPTPDAAPGEGDFPDWDPNARAKAPVTEEQPHVVVAMPRAQPRAPKAPLKGADAPTVGPVAPPPPPAPPPSPPPPRSGATGSIRVELNGSLPMWSNAWVAISKLGLDGAPMAASPDNRPDAMVRDGQPVAVELPAGRYRVSWRVDRPAFSFARFSGHGGLPAVLAHLEHDVDVVAGQVVTISFEAPARWGLRVGLAGAAAVGVAAVWRWHVDSRASTEGAPALGAGTPPELT